MGRSALIVVRRGTDIIYIHDGDLARQFLRCGPCGGSETSMNVVPSDTKQVDCPVGRQARTVPSRSARRRARAAATRDGATQPAGVQIGHDIGAAASQQVFGSSYTQSSVPHLGLPLEVSIAADLRVRGGGDFCGGSAAHGSATTVAASGFGDASTVFDLACKEDSIVCDVARKVMDVVDLSPAAKYPAFVGESESAFVGGSSTSISSRSSSAGSVASYCGDLSYSSRPVN